jgi:flagellar basal body-associated protein FliL
MKKLAIVSLLVLLLSIGFGVYYLLSNLDSIVKAAIESYGSEATQTTVRVEKVQLELTDGSGAIRGLTVGNPKGFTAAQAFSLGEIATQVDLKSLSEEVTVIEHIIVRAPEVFFELNEAGKNNLEKLNKNLSSGASSKSGSSSPKSSGAEPKLIIRKLLFEGGSIHARIVSLDKDYDLKLPKIEMTNLGGKTGATPEEIADQVLKKLTAKALAEVKRKGLDQYKEKLEDEVNQRLDSEKEKLGEKLGGQLKGVLDY